MTPVPPSDAAIILLAQAFEAFKYFALDSSTTPYSTTQSAPISEITGAGGARAAATISQDSSTGVVTMSHQWIFTNTLVVGAICPMNSPNVGTGTALCRFIPDSGTLPDSFKTGGSLLATFECSMAVSA